MVSFTVFSPSKAAVRDTVPWPWETPASRSRRLWSFRYQMARVSFSGIFASSALVLSLRVMPQRVKKSVRSRSATAEAVRANRSW